MKLEQSFGMTSGPVMKSVACELRRDASKLSLCEAVAVHTCELLATSCASSGALRRHGLIAGSDIHC